MNSSVLERNHLKVIQNHSVLMELVEIAVKSADKQALETRCLRALSKLASLHPPNEFLLSSDAGNLVHSLKSNVHLKPVIRESADHVVTQWKRQLYKKEKAPQSPNCQKSVLKQSQNESRIKAAANLKPSNLPKPQHKNSAAEQMRNNIRQQILQGLNMVLEEGNFNSSCDPIGVAMRVESALFQIWGGNKQKYRSFLFNLKDNKNPDFRRKILMGQVKAEKIATMGVEEMGSDQRRIQNHFIRETALNKCIVAS